MARGLDDKSSNCNGRQLQVRESRTLPVVPVVDPPSSTGGSEQRVAPSDELYAIGGEIVTNGHANVITTAAIIHSNNDADVVNGGGDEEVICCNPTATEPTLQQTQAATREMFRQFVAEHVPSDAYERVRDQIQPE